MSPLLNITFANILTRIGSAQCLERLLLAAATIFGNQLVNGAGKQLVGFLYLHLQWEFI